MSDLDVMQSLIALYFPVSEQAHALCVMNAECPPGSTGWPASCIVGEGQVDCGAGVREAIAYGPFGILDVCFDPAMNPASPFTPEQWAMVLDPNVNTWMASVVYSAYGWRAWTTCGDCDICDVTGLPVPYPRGPVATPPGYPGYSVPGPSGTALTQPTQMAPASSDWTPLLVFASIGFAGGAIYRGLATHKRLGRPDLRRYIR